MLDECRNSPTIFTSNHSLPQTRVTLQSFLTLNEPISNPQRGQAYRDTPILDETLSNGLRTVSNIVTR